MKNQGWKFTRQNQPRPLAWVKDGDCIRCTSHTGKRGYPTMQRNGKSRTVARWILNHRRADEKLHALHTCDNAWCINPHHIYAGTNKDNMRDVTARGRWGVRCGESNGRAKLTISDVRYIRTASKTQSLSQLARKHGVTVNTIHGIISGRIWSKVY